MALPFVSSFCGSVSHFTVRFSFWIAIGFAQPDSIFWQIGSFSLICHPERNIDNFCVLNPEPFHCLGAKSLKEKIRAIFFFLIQPDFPPCIRVVLVAQILRSFIKGGHYKGKYPHLNPRPPPTLSTPRGLRALARWSLLVQNLPKFCKPYSARIILKRIFTHRLDTSLKVFLPVHKAQHLCEKPKVNWLWSKILVQNSLFSCVNHTLLDLA